MARTLTQKIIDEHRVDEAEGSADELAIRIDQTLTQDATGTLVMLELEAMGLDRVRTELSAQYVDHNIFQADQRNADDHLFLESACRRFGVWYSRPGNGVSHPVHMQRFGVPGKTMLGSDSHTPAAGSLGMLAIGAGGLDVALAMAGRPYRTRKPGVFGVALTGALPDWVSAKDVILEMLRRHGVDGAVNMVLEYFGPGVEALSAMDRHVIANMGTELGATSTVFPSDGETRRFLASEGRGEAWRELAADEGAEYDRVDSIDLSSLVPLIAEPSSPGNVVPVEEVEGAEIYQAYIGSSANPGYRDFAVCARMVAGRTLPHTVSFDINPTSRQLIAALLDDGSMASLIGAGARLHQTGCNGCIGMGQAPATGRNSLRTVPRNFPGRSGTPEDCVYLCSPETATASALAGRITDPRRMAMAYPRIVPRDRQRVDTDLVEAPPPPEEAHAVELVRSENIQPLPDFDPIPEDLTLRVLLTVGDHVSTDEILPAGTRVLPYRSNIDAISDFAFSRIDAGYAKNAREVSDRGEADGHAIVAGRNYGQGSSREHAALAPRYLGLRAVFARSFARIHRQNLVNFGVLPVEVEDDGDLDRLGGAAEVALVGIRNALEDGEEEGMFAVKADETETSCRLALSAREREILLYGGLIPWMRAEG